MAAGRGKSTSGQLEAISVKGGCATVATAHEEGTLVLVRFSSSFGPITGIAHMLKAQIVGNTKKQSFRFLGLGEDDHRHLTEALDLL